MTAMIKNIGLTLIAFCVFALPSLSLKADEMDKRITKAIEILAKKQKSGNPIPAALLKKAKGIAIIEISRGGIGVGGSDGGGIVLAKTAKGGWSAPVAFNQSGASIGLQLGFETKQFIYVIMSESMLNNFLGDTQYKFDAKATGTAGPDNVGTTATPSSDIYVYQTSDGAFAGATIGGQFVRAADDVNRKAYGVAVVPKEIASGKVKPPKSAGTLYELLKLSK